MPGRPSTPTGTRWIILGLLAVSIPLLAWLMTRGPSSEVLVVGDSVTFMSVASIDRALGDDVKLQAVAEPGYRSTDLLPLVEQNVRGRDVGDDAAVFLVGYNDVIHGRSESPELPKLVELSATFRCAVWLTLPTLAEDFPLGYDQATAEAWNESLRALVERHDNVHVEEAWSEGMDAEVGGTPLTTDGIHPNKEGQRLLGQAMAASLERACPDE